MARQPKYIWLRELLGSDRSRHLSVILLTHLIWCRAGGQASQLTASIILQTPEVAYVDAQRNCAVALGERDVKTDVWNKESFNSLHLSDVSIVLSWLVRFECPPYRQGERDSAPGRPQETLLTCIWARWEREAGTLDHLLSSISPRPGPTSPHQARPRELCSISQKQLRWITTMKMHSYLEAGIKMILQTTLERYI